MILYIILNQGSSTFLDNGLYIYVYIFILQILILKDK